MIPATDMGCNFTGIASHDVMSIRHLIAPLIEKPLKRMDAEKYYTVDDVIKKCVNKDWQCWVAWSDLGGIDCVFITYISPKPTGYRSFIVHLVGGTRINEWLSIAWNVLKDYARHHGCQEINGAGREGWLRVLKRVEDKPIVKHIRFTVEL